MNKNEKNKFEPETEYGKLFAQWYSTEEGRKSREKANQLLKEGQKRIRKDRCAIRKKMNNEINI